MAQMLPAARGLFKARKNAARAAISLDDMTTLAAVLPGRLAVLYAAMATPPDVREVA